MTTTNEPPMIVDLMSESVINQWFDYWVMQNNRQANSRTDSNAIERIRRLALAGASKAKRNQKAIVAVLADVFDGMAADARSGKIKVQAFSKGGDERCELKV